MVRDFLLGGIVDGGRPGDENHAVECVVGCAGDKAFCVDFLEEISTAIKRLNFGGEQVSGGVPQGTADGPIEVVVGEGAV
jgi:hypothetical protein